MAKIQGGGEYWQLRQIFFHCILPAVGVVTGFQPMNSGFWVNYSTTVLLLIPFSIYTDTLESMVVKYCLKGNIFVQKKFESFTISFQVIKTSQFSSFKMWKNWEIDKDFFCKSIEERKNEEVLLSLGVKATKTFFRHHQLYGKISLSACPWQVFPR